LSRSRSVEPIEETTTTRSVESVPEPIKDTTITRSVESVPEPIKETTITRSVESVPEPIKETTITRSVESVPEPIEDAATSAIETSAKNLTFTPLDSSKGHQQDKKERGSSNVHHHLLV
jgi:hypothetical protein